MFKRALLFAICLSLSASALERTWYTQLNTVLDTTSVSTSAKSELWTIGAALTGNTNAWTGVSTVGMGAWTVWCSSNGVSTAADNCSTDHSDYWAVSGSGVYSAANFVRAAAGSAHSWIVYKSPAYNGNSYYLLMDWSTASDQTVTFAWSKTAMTCAVNPCTVATAPTAADITTANTSITFNPNNIVAQNRLHWSVSAAGDFWFTPSRDTAAFSTAPFIWNFIADFKNVDVVPVMWSPGLTTPGGGSGGTPGQITNCAAAAPWLNARSTANAGVASMCCATLVTYISNNATNILGAFTNTNVVLNGLDLANSTYVDAVMYVFSSTSPNTTFRGRMVDFRWAPSTLAAGVMGPSVAPYSVMIGLNSAGSFPTAMWVPVNTSSVPTL